MAEEEEERWPDAIICRPRVVMAAVRPARAVNIPADVPTRGGACRKRCCMSAFCRA